METGFLTNKDEYVISPRLVIQESTTSNRSTVTTMAMLMYLRFQQTCDDQCAPGACSRVLRRSWLLFLDTTTSRATCSRPTVRYLGIMVLNLTAPDI